MRLSPYRSRKGNAVTEFALVSVFLVPLLMGTVNVGMSLGRAVQVNQVTRDAGHMYVRQIDFSKLPNQRVIERLGESIGLRITSSPNTSKGVVILTKILFVGATECAAGGFSTTNCPNFNQPVITQRLVMGKSSLLTSKFGTPSSSIVSVSDGSISTTNYLVHFTARATTINDLIALQPGDQAYIAETFFEAPEWSFPGFYPSTGVYSRAIY